MIDLWSDPAKRIELSMVSNPYLELNDALLVFDLYTYTDDIFSLQTIRETWSDPSLKSSLVLTDRGFDLGQFIWDRNGETAGTNDLKYDIGFVWDQDLEIGGSDDTTYRKMVNFDG
jgi:hypothetical protein